MDNKQKEQSRKRQQRYRDSQKRNAITAKRNENVTEAELDECVTVTEAVAALPPNFSQSDCHCRHCCNNRKHGNRLTINHGPYKPSSELSEGEVNRVSLPGVVHIARRVA